MNERVRRAEREDSIRRTVYVSDIDNHVSSTGFGLKKLFLFFFFLCFLFVMMDFALGD